MDSKAYLDRITSAHITRPRFMAWLKVLLDMLCEYANVAQGMNLAFYVESAVGDQLDAVGKLVGASRALPYTSTFATDGLLGDTDYRSYIRAKILQNMWDGTNESLPGLWQSVYPSLQMSYVDNMDMSMSITVTGDISDAMTEMIQAGLIVPKPAGVSQTIVVNTTTIPAAEVSLGTGLYEYGNDEFPNQGG